MKSGRLTKNTHSKFDRFLIKESFEDYDLDLRSDSSDIYIFEDDFGTLCIRDNEKISDLTCTEIFDINKSSHIRKSNHRKGGLIESSF